MRRISVFLVLISLSPVFASGIKVIQPKQVAVDSSAAATRPTNPQPGRLFFNATTKRFEGYNGTAWIELDTIEGSTAGGDLSGTFPNPTVAKINGVALGSATATSGHILIANGSAWQTKSVSGDVAIDSGGVATVGKINGATLGTTTATSGNILVADGSQWSTVAVSGEITLTRTGAATVGTITTLSTSNDTLRTVSFTVPATHALFPCTLGITATLPDATAVPGRIVTFLSRTGSGKLFIVPAGSQKINGTLGADSSITATWKVLAFKSVDSNWVEISNH